MPKLKDVVWAQEEARNNGAWTFVEPMIEACLAEAGKAGLRPQYAGRAVERVAGDRARQAPLGGAGGLDRRRRWVIAAGTRGTPPVGGRMKVDDGD